MSIIDDLAAAGIECETVQTQLERGCVRAAITECPAVEVLARIAIELKGKCDRKNFVLDYILTSDDHNLHLQMIAEDLWEEERHG